MKVIQYIQLALEKRFPDIAKKLKGDKGEAETETPVGGVCYSYCYRGSGGGGDDAEASGCD